MNCETAREAISALLDGEAPGVHLALLEAHLAQCAACRAWREDAHEITRRARVTVARPAPPPWEALVASLPLGGERQRWWRSRALTRGALVVVALGQLAVTVPALILGSDHDAPLHVAHEMGSFDMALAVGFLVAAWRPVRAQGMRALVGVAALLLALTAVIDLVAGRTTPSDEAPHLIVVVGWLILARVAALTPTSGDDQGVPLVGWPRRRARSAPLAVAEPEIEGGGSEVATGGAEKTAWAQLSERADGAERSLGEPRIAVGGSERRSAADG